jgi:ketosteroid isomerase-like protein
MDTPREVAEKLVAGISAGHFDQVAALYAEDCLIEIPYVFGATPNRIEGGDSVRAHFRGADQIPFVLRARDHVVHETADPELVVSEWDYVVTAKATGRTGTFANVQLLRVRDGLIVHSKDFHDHRGLAELAAAQ